MPGGCRSAPLGLRRPAIARRPFALSLLLILLSAAPQSSAELLAAEATSIRPEALRAHVGFLADDLLEGRFAGTRGYDLAARYGAAQLEAAGIEPAGVDGFFQPVPLRQTELLREEATASLLGPQGEVPLALEEHYLLTSNPFRERFALEAPVVFVGYGIVAPGRGHDDYQGIDVAGRYVLALSGAPPSFGDTERAHHSAGRTKLGLAVERGARGVVLVRTTEDLERVPWERSVRGNRFPGMRRLGPDDRPTGAAWEALEVQATLNDAGARLLLGLTQEELDALYGRARAGERVSRALPVTLRIQGRGSHHDLESPNVVGVLPGSDPALRHQYVVFTAHLDHLGVLRQDEAEEIHNGALDNAAGTAMVLEIARALAARPERPRRSILFLLVTAEERGLLGSEHFVDHPTVPAPSIVANLNIDMPLILFPFRDVITRGGEHSTLGAVAARAAAALGLEVAPDPVPEEVIFVRSDQYSFVRRGIPALYIGTGLTSDDPEVDGAAVVAEWLRAHYHRPSDTAQQPLDFVAGARLAQLNLLVALEVADADERPTWKPGDFFGTLFGPERDRTESSP